MEAFVEKIQKLENAKMRNDTLRTFIGAQGDGKTVTKFMQSFEVSSSKTGSNPEEMRESLLSDFTKGFKGIE